MVLIRSETNDAGVTNALFGSGKQDAEHTPNNITNSGKHDLVASGNFVPRSHLTPITRPAIERVFFILQDTTAIVRRLALNLDSLGRRANRVRPPSTGRRVSLTLRDLLWFEKLHRHGPLPSSFLADYAGPVAANTIAKRLTLLSSEDRTPHGGRYLRRPKQQFATIDARHQQLVFATNAKSQEALAERDRLYPNTPSASSRSWKHDHMTACVCASIELGTLRQPEHYQYIFHDEIVTRIGREHFVVDSVTVRPDRWGGIRYHNRGVLLFAVETDCGTEPLRSNRLRKSIKRNIMQYEAWISRGQYKQDLGGNVGIAILHVTNSKSRMSNMLALAVQTLAKQKASYLAYFNIAGFGPIYKPPRPMAELFFGSWQRPGHAPLSIAY